MKTMFLLTIFLALELSASGTTVKLTRSDDAPREGSGWLVNSKNGAFVMTAEHVFPGSHYGSPPVHIYLGSKRYSGQVVFEDWLLGVEAIKIDEPIPEFTEPFVEPAELRDLQDGLRVGDSVWLTGYAFGQEALQEHQAQVQILSSHRLFLPFENGIEVVNTWGELGMSGGPVFKNKAKQSVKTFAGLTSDLIQKNASGVVEPISSPGTITDRVFLIPRKTVFAILRPLIENEEQPSFAVPTYAYTDIHKEKITALNLGSDIVLNPVFESTPMVVAGGDGAGIGGNRHCSNQPGFIEISHYLNINVIPLPPTLKNLKPFLDRLKEMSWQKLEWVGFLKKDAKTHLVSKVNIFCLEEAIDGLNDPSLSPLVWEGRESRTSRYSEFGNLAEETKALLKSPELQEVFRRHPDFESRLDLQIDLSRDGYEPLFDKDHINQVLNRNGENEEALEDLYAADYSKARDLIAHLFKLNCNVNGSCRPE